MKAAHQLFAGPVRRSYGLRGGYQGSFSGERRSFFRKSLRRGITLPFMILSFMIFVVFAAMTVDIAYMQLVRAQLRVATDAASRAGAAALMQTQDTGEAFAAALSCAQQNMVAGSGMQLSPGDVEFGASIRQADGTWQFVPNATPLTACRVSAALANGEARGPVPLLLGSVLGVHTFSPTERATASFSENEICLVVDRSHSMCFDLTGVTFSYPPGVPSIPDPICYPPHATLSRWASLQAGVNQFLDTVASTNANQKVGLVTWGSDISLFTYEGMLTGRSFPATALDVPIGLDHTAIRSAIAARGGDIMLGATNMSAGINMGISVLTGPGTRPQANKVMIVMTDGRWNQGNNPVTAATAARNLGITVHTITFLDAANQADMMQVAQVGGGQHYHASNQAALIAAFEELATSLPVSLTE